MDTINVSQPNDGLGDKLRDAFVIVNDNFTELSTLIDTKLDLPSIVTLLNDYTTNIEHNQDISNIETSIDNLTTLVNNNSNDITSISNALLILTGQIGGLATLIQLNDSFTTLNNTIANLNNIKINDAPSDGNAYIRKDGFWININNI